MTLSLGMPHEILSKAQDVRPSLVANGQLNTSAGYDSFRHEKEKSPRVRLW